MQPPSRARRILKWTGIGLSTLIISMWIWSKWWGIFLITPNGRWEPIEQAVAPFWFLLLITALPTAWLWHRDRRRATAS